MESGIVVLKSYARSKILHEWKGVIIKELNIVLSIEITLCNHKIHTHGPCRQHGLC